MIIYFSWKGYTRTYALELAALSNDTAFELVEKKKRSRYLGLLAGGFQSVLRKEAEVTEIPDLDKVNEIYVCSPIWAAGITPATRYFINHAPLKSVKVNFLLTCAKIDQHEEYRKGAFKALQGTGAEEGAAYVFACPTKEVLDIETVRNHIKKVILGIE